MILRDMIIRFWNSMDDSNKVYWNDVRATALANRFKDKIAQELRVTTGQHYTFDSVEGQQRYEVPDKYVTNEKLYYNSSYNQEIHILEGPGAIYGPYSQVTLEGWPTRGFIWRYSGRRELTIYPTFNVAGIEVQWWFWGFPSDIEEDNDEPNFPADWHPSIVEGMINERAVRDGELGMADALILWKDEIRKIRGLETFKSLAERSKQYGTFDGNFPRISVSQDKEEFPFRIVGTDGGIW